MAIVVLVLQSADHRLCRADPGCEFLLTQACIGPKLVDGTGDLGMDSGGLQLRLARGIIFDGNRSREKNHGRTPMDMD